MQWAEPWRRWTPGCVPTTCCPIHLSLSALTHSRSWPKLNWKSSPLGSLGLSRTLVSLWTKNPPSPALWWLLLLPNYRGIQNPVIDAAAMRVHSKFRGSAMFLKMWDVLFLADCILGRCIGMALPSGVSSPYLWWKLCCSTLDIQDRGCLQSICTGWASCHWIADLHKTFSVAGPATWNGLSVVLHLVHRGHTTVFYSVLFRVDWTRSTPE